MPRTPDDPDQMLYAHDLYSRLGFRSAAGITRKLDLRYGENAKSERSVSRWIKRFREIADSFETRGLDEPFAWHRMEEYGLPWEAGPLLLRVSEHLRHVADLLEGFPILTGREARWCWRIHQAAPSIEAAGNQDLVEVARAFAQRQIRTEVLSEVPDFRDLEAWLAYRPWQFDDKSMTQEGADTRYLAAVKSGFVPELRPTAGAGSDLETSIAAFQAKDLEQLHAKVSSFWPSSEQRAPLWLLPSQQARYNEELSKEKSGG